MHLNQDRIKLEKNLENTSNISKGPNTYIINECEMTEHHKTFILRATKAEYLGPLVSPATEDLDKSSLKKSEIEQN